jgi:hypothetical protein
MKLLLKGFRNGLGAIIALISWLIPVRKVKRGEKKLAKLSLTCIANTWEDLELISAEIFHIV